MTSFETWQDFWIAQGFGSTVGRIRTLDTGKLNLVAGTLDAKQPWNPNSTERRYKLPGNSFSKHNEAGNVDPAVLMEWAEAHDVLIKVAAGPTEQQDLKYVSDSAGNTWYEMVLRPWTIQREAGGGGKPAGDDNKALDPGLLLALPELLSLVRGLREGSASIDDNLATLQGRVTDTFSIIDEALRKLTALQDAQHKALFSELKALKNQVAKLAKGRP